MLHTVNKSPFRTNDLQTCLRHLGDGALLLIEDAVYAASPGTRVAEQVEQAASRNGVYVLANDLQARGVSQDQLIPGVKPVDYQGFVELVVEHGTPQAWL